MTAFASTLNSVEKLNARTTDHGERVCNITFLAMNYGISSMDQTPYHQQMLKQQKGEWSKLERPRLFSL
ncbi:hypothetical protein H5410_047411 [Solanum commersonii]|uniref:Uncharacterized protein n=1 Tax=Solanum commersonii TaxID=4109 RepID=A0A9J5XF19_SOLCO|nr:hypothetical protein H5410_047411 [Solanum commersonii]